MSPVRSDIIEMYKAAVVACMPEQAVVNHLQDCFDEMKPAGRLVVVAIGKAADSMARGALSFFESQGIDVDQCFVVVPSGSSVSVSQARVYYAGHPIPDENSLSAARDVLSCVKALGEKDLVLLLISGGGSALFELPAPPMSLPELQHWYAELIESGLSIHEMNAHRQSRSLVKGGKLARATPAAVLQLLLSDVPGDDPAIVASGPGYAPDLPRNVTRIVGSAAVALEAATEKAVQLGYRVLPLTASLQGDAAQTGRWLAGIAARMSLIRPDRPLALLATGETTVHVTGTGRGGRNMHLALAAAIELDGMLDDASVTIASLGTDGRDGPTDAAGAVVDAQTVAQMKEKGFDASQLLDACDSYTGLDAVDVLYRCGYTGTNVNDLLVCLIR